MIITADDGLAFVRLPDVAARSLGGAVVWASDESFGPKENLIAPGDAVHTEATFDHRGQVYDGWETRRRRAPGHDEAVIRLAAPTVVRGVVVDTAHFTGNCPPEISVEAATVVGYQRGAQVYLDARWRTIVARQPAAGGCRNTYASSSQTRFTHVKLTLYPDGGVARLRIHGTPGTHPDQLTGVIDCAATLSGAVITDCSDQFYGSAANLLAPGPARSMGEGWETARRRDRGHDWVRIALVGTARLTHAEIDTSYFLGNAPASAALSGRTDDGTWVPLLNRTDLVPDTVHRLRLLPGPPVREVQLDIFPDGGLARMRLWGSLTNDGLAALRTQWHADGTPSHDA